MNKISTQTVRCWTYLCLTLMIVLAGFTARSQTIAISGKVVSAADQSPLAGVTVVIQGKATGTITDLDGKYAIHAAQADTLIFTFLGHTSQKIVVNHQVTINVSLALTEASLDQVVVVGYGTRKKSELTNAVVQINGDVATKTPSVSLTSSLEGQLAGLNIVQNASSPGFDNPFYNIRGANTFGINSPLIVIDGVANADPEGLNKLNPNDIASISVLKDASAAIYGVEAAGGVILVTTKRGNLGETKVNVVTSSALQFPTRLSRMADAVSFMRAVNSKNELDGTSITYTDADIALYTSGEKTSTNWLPSLLSTPVYQGKYDVTVSGGTQKVKYFISAGMADQNSALVNDEKFKLNQGNFRSNLDVNLFEGLDLGIDLSFRSKQTKTSSYGAGGQLGASLDFNPTLPAFINGDINLPTNGDGSLSPVAVAMSNGFIKYDTKVYNGRVSLKYSIPKTNGLYVSTFISMIQNSNFTKNFITPYNFYTQDETTKLVTENQTTLPGGYVNGLYEDFSQNLRVTSHAEVGYKFFLTTFITCHYL